MCELQFLKRTDGKNLQKGDLFDFIKFMHLGNIYNSHAFGFFNSIDLFRCSGHFEYTKMDDKLITSDNFVVGHNRFATSGILWNPNEDYDDEYPAKQDNKNLLENNPFFVVNADPGNNSFLWLSRLWKDKGGRGGYSPKIKTPKTKKKEIDMNLNNHPFLLGRFIMVHNGIIRNHYLLRKEYNIPYFPETDSFVIIWLIDKFFKKSNLKTDKEKIIESIRKTTKLIKGGYSIFLFDRENKELFYFRNSKNTFTFFRRGNLLIGSTNTHNIKRIYCLKKKRKDRTKLNFIYPKPETIYLIGDKYIKKVGDFKDMLQTEENKEMKGGKIKR